MHVLVDSDVALNVYLHGVPGHTRQQPMESAQVIAASVRGRIHAYLTPTAYSNTYYIMHKVLSLADTNASAADLLSAMDILGQDERTFRQALASGWADVEDAGQYFAAKSDPRITHLCTTNVRHFKKATGIKVVTPAQLLALLK
jgi:hypothetical protein